MALTADPKHFLNQQGVEYIWRTYIKPQFESLNLSDYPDNHFLAQVISAIDEVKADKADIPNIYFDTTANFDAIQTASENCAIYIYTDYQQENGKDIAGIKIGDGSAALSELPYIDAIMMNHINNTTIHITAAERTAWNNKMRGYYADGDILVLTTN